MFLHTRGKRQSKQWKHPGSSRHRKRNTVPSAEKLQKGQTINGTYYASLLIQFREYIKLKSRRRLEHPPNYCEFAPSDFHLIPKLKKKKHAISGTHFRSNNEAIFHLFCFLSVIVFVYISVRHVSFAPCSQQRLCGDNCITGIIRR